MKDLKSEFSNVNKVIEDLKNAKKQVEDQLHAAKKQIDGLNLELSKSKMTVNDRDATIAGLQK